MPGMPTDDRDDPGADTAMFRAYVDHPTDPPAAPAANRTLLIAAIAVIAIVVLVGLIILA
jgi:hypothetical protein